MKNNILKIINVILLFFVFLLGSIIIYKIYSNNLLQFSKLNIIISAIIILLFLFLFIFTLKNKLNITRFILSLILVALYALGLNELNKGLNLVEQLNKNAEINSYTMSVVVLKDSTINSVHDIKSNSVLAPLATDKENINSLINDIKEKENINLNLLEGESYTKQYEKLLSKESEIIILNSGYENLIALSHPDYQDKIKKIYELKIEQTVNKKTTQNNMNAFNVYISGIDTFGPITTVARSDVNIIMTVNRDTNKILLTTTPRDAYVKIADGGNNQYDKLTHAGVYGVDASIHTLENLYNTKIDYYTRINFTSFLKLIDLLGGVEVYNEQEFTSMHGKYHFPIGIVKLDSDKALGFVRERYSLASGDNDRGKNQQKVITAIIKKLTTTEAINNYKNIVEELSASIQTDMPVKTIMNLANDQLDSKSEYVVSSQALTGTGAMGLPSYAMPGYNLYMTKINEDSLIETSTNIKNTLEGK